MFMVPCLATLSTETELSCRQVKSIAAEASLPEFDFKKQVG
jgi:hypothetical protein